MGLRGMPGIEGLGCCCYCGEMFVKEILFDLSGLDNGTVQTICIDGFEDDFCIHKDCMEKLQAFMGKQWSEIVTDLPECGPLRRGLEKAAGQEARE